MKPVKTWILVADGARARIYLNDGPGHGIQPVPEMTFETEIKPAREIEADKPGRTFDSAGTGRHAKEKPTDTQRLEEQRFLSDVADKVKDAAYEGAFDRLVLIAPPKALGDLRKFLHDTLKDKIVAEISKDLVRADTNQLQRQLESVLPI